jgi:hypothetical protein
VGEFLTSKNIAVVPQPLYLSDLYSVPEDQNRLQVHYFETTNNIQKAVTNTPKDFTEEDFRNASRGGRGASSGVLLLKGTTWEGITLKCKNFSNNFF